MDLIEKQFGKLINSNEDEHLEFKEAKNHFDFEKLVKYCVALANEGGGKIILGVTDRNPRNVVGTTALGNIEKTKAGLIGRLHLRIDIDEISYQGQRVLIVSVPSRPVGMPVQYKGAYWMRGGEDLIPMTPDRLKQIFAESQPDFSAQICSGATMDDLDSQAIETFRKLWVRRSRNRALSQHSDQQLLTDAELVVDNGITLCGSCFMWFS